MKRFLIIILLFVPVLSAVGQSRQIIDKYSKSEGVEYQEIGPALLKIALLSAKGPERDMMKGVKKVNLLNLSAAASYTRESFLNDVDDLRSQGFDLLSDNSEENQRILTYAHKSGNTIDRLLIITIGLNSDLFMSMDLTGEIILPEIDGK